MFSKNRKLGYRLGVEYGRFEQEVQISIYSCVEKFVVYIIVRQDVWIILMFEVFILMREGDLLILIIFIYCTIFMIFGILVPNTITR